MFSNSPTLRVTLNESNVFTNPSINSAEEPSDDPIFSGTITLNLRKRRAIKVIKVLLEGNSCIYGGSAFKIQYRPTLRKEVSIDFKNEFLESGEHQSVILLFVLFLFLSNEIFDLRKLSESTFVEGRKNLP